MSLWSGSESSVAFPSGKPSQVFVDDSGRRRRWVGAAGVAVTAFCGLYIGIVVIGLSQTAVGPLLDVPAGGNGVIAGFPSSAGVIPGLLAHGAPSRTGRATGVRGVSSSVPRKVATRPATVKAVTSGVGVSAGTRSTTRSGRA